MITMDTTITISTQTKERIRKMGNMGDSYDTVINRVFDEMHKLKTYDYYGYYNNNIHTNKDLVDMKSTTKNYPTPRHIDLFGDDVEPDHEQ